MRRQLANAQTMVMRQQYDDLLARLVTHRVEQWPQLGKQFVIRVQSHASMIVVSFIFFNQ